MGDGVVAGDVGGGEDVHQMVGVVVAGEGVEEGQHCYLQLLQPSLQQ